MVFIVYFQYSIWSGSSSCNFLNFIPVKILVKMQSMHITFMDVYCSKFSSQTTWLIRKILISMKWTNVLLVISKLVAELLVFCLKGMYLQLSEQWQYPLCAKTPHLIILSLTLQIYWNNIKKNLKINYSIKCFSYGVRFFGYPVFTFYFWKSLICLKMVLLVLKDSL